LASSVSYAVFHDTGDSKNVKYGNQPAYMKTKICYNTNMGIISATALQTPRNIAEYGGGGNICNTKYHTTDHPPAFSAKVKSKWI
jgi:hypothetical protein